jgi:hypothetical protein
MNSENYEKLPEILKYNRELAEKFWKDKDEQKCLNSANQLMASAYL